MCTNRSRNVFGKRLGEAWSCRLCVAKETRFFSVRAAISRMPIRADVYRQGVGREAGLEEGDLDPRENSTKFFSVFSLRKQVGELSKLKRWPRGCSSSDGESNDYTFPAPGYV